MKLITNYFKERIGCDINIYELEQEGCRHTFLIEIEDYIKRYANIKLSYNSITKQGYLHSFNNLTSCPLGRTLEYIQNLKNVAKDYFKDIQIDDNLE